MGHSGGISVTLAGYDLVVVMVNSERMPSSRGTRSSSRYSVMV